MQPLVHHKAKRGRILLSLILKLQHASRSCGEIVKNIKRWAHAQVFWSLTLQMGEKGWDLPKLSQRMSGTWLLGLPRAPLTGLHLVRPYPFFPGRAHGPPLASTEVWERW